MLAGKLNLVHRQVFHSEVYCPFSEGQRFNCLWIDDTLGIYLIPIKRVLLLLYLTCSYTYSGMQQTVSVIAALNYSSTYLSGAMILNMYALMFETITSTGSSPTSPYFTTGHLNAMRNPSPFELSNTSMSRYKWMLL